MTKKNKLKEFLGYLIVVVIAVAFSLTLRTFIFEPFIVPTPSMEPTLLVGDKVIVNKLSYRWGKIGRGDLVVFYSPTEPGKELVKKGYRPSRGRNNFDYRGPDIDKWPKYGRKLFYTTI